jgi:hypothetical protein
MRELYAAAKAKLEAACKGQEDVCSVRYYAGYLQAIKDIDRRLKANGLDELEEA